MLRDQRGLAVTLPCAHRALEVGQSAGTSPERFGDTAARVRIPSRC